MTKNMDDKPYMFMEGEDVADWLDIDPLDQVAMDEWLYGEEFEWDE